MKLYVLGVGDTFTEKHVSHALLLEADGFRLAIDCPDSYRRVLRPARERAGSAHAAYADLLTLDDSIERKMHLIHHPDDFDVDGSAIPALLERQVIEL